MTYPLESAIVRNRILAYACFAGIDRAMRKLHDGPDIPDGTTDPWLAVLTLERAVAVAKWHRRMNVDETRCKWCGVAAAEARAELEADDAGSV